MGPGLRCVAFRVNKEVRVTDATDDDPPVDGVTVKDDGWFQRFADWVSEAMGSPGNIVVWLVAVIGWVSIFAFGGPRLASGSWLPAWFTSLGFNFPLNLVTTVAELFIGFLVATAANRSQRALTALLNRIEKQEHQIGQVERNLAEQLQQNTDLTAQVHALSKEMHEMLVALAAKS
jgi:low affinity Fe/Cu permease